MKIKELKKELKTKFKKLFIDIEKDENGQWLNIYNFENKKDIIGVNVYDNTINLYNLDYNGDDAWEVINFLRENYNFKLEQLFFIKPQTSLQGGLAWGLK